MNSLGCQFNIILINYCSFEKENQNIIMYCVVPSTLKNSDFVEKEFFLNSDIKPDKPQNDLNYKIKENPFILQRIYSWLS